MRLESGSKLAWMAVNSVLVYDVRICVLWTFFGVYMMSLRKLSIKKTVFWFRVFNQKTVE